MKTLSRTLRTIGRTSPIKLYEKLFHRKRHAPPHSGLKRWKPIWCSKEDHTLITVWAKERNITHIAMAHLLVTSFMVCVEQQHEKEIKRVTAERDLLFSTLGDYIKRFGKIEYSKH